MAKYKTEEDVRNVLRRRIKFGVTIRDLALEYELPHSTLHAFLMGKHSLSDQLALKFGYKKVFIEGAK